MRQANLFMMSAAMLLAACGGTKDAGKTDQVLIEKSDIKIEGKRMTPEALWAMGRIGGLAVSPDGKKIAYTVAYYSVPENKSNREVFVMNADGSDNRQITRTPYQENEVTWIKGGTKLAFLSNDNGSSQLYEMNPDGSGRKQLTNYDGDIEGYSISPDGKKLLFISQVKTKESTADKYPDLPKATGIIVTDLMYKHWDEWVTTAPHPFVADFDGNGISNIVDILEGEPYESPMKPWGGIEQLAWNMTSDKVAYGETQIYSLDLTNDSVKAITSGMYDYEGVALFGDKLIAKRHSMSMGDEIYAVALDGSATQLTQENKEIYDQLEMGKVEGRWMKTTDGKDMLTWVIYPPQFDPNKKYPTLLFCEGGPQSPVSQFWSYRWNFQIMAANDYIIVAPNRRGLPGFGVEWNEQISGDYGGQCMKDYFTAIDEMAKESYVDKDRLGCVGASFGGFSVYWLAGHHDKRFKAFIAHDGIFNMEMQYLETEEKWFANWDMGGAYWEKQNPIAQRTFANSPHLFVEKWDTPILCIHGEKDFRILANQAMAAFDAAVMRGVPAELLIYPDENHWVLKPQNGVLWQRTFFEWLDKWLKAPAK